MITNITSKINLGHRVKLIDLLSRDITSIYTALTVHNVNFLFFYFSMRQTKIKVNFQKILADATKSQAVAIYATKLHNNS